MPPCSLCNPCRGHRFLARPLPRIREHQTGKWKRCGFVEANIGELITIVTPTSFYRWAEIDTLKLNQIEVKSYVGGLVMSFERKAA